MAAKTVVNEVIVLIRKYYFYVIWTNDVKFVFQYCLFMPLPFEEWWRGIKC